MYEKYRGDQLNSFQDLYILDKTKWSKSRDATIQAYATLARLGNDSGTIRTGGIPVSLQR